MDDEIGSRRTRLRAGLRRLQSLYDRHEVWRFFGGICYAIEWVARIVKSRLEDRPVLVVSAMGKTTDRLAEMMQHAARGSAYSVWCLFEELCRFHFQEVKRLLGAGRDRRVGERIAPKFRELHGLLIYLEDGCILTPDLKDQILSFGEPLSSEIVAAAFERL